METNKLKIKRSNSSAQNNALSSQATQGTSPVATKPPRRYGFACQNCRRKKVRCNGERPECDNCKKAGEECGYMQNSTELQLRRAQTRIRTLEKRLKSLAIATDADGHGDNSNVAGADSTTDTPDSEAEEDEFWTQVGIDEEGTPSYHGQTSRFHIAVDAAEKKSAAIRPKLEAENTRSYHVECLHSNAELQRRVWEPLIVAKMDYSNGIPPEMSLTLLQIYWTWQHPLHHCIYRPTFTRDLALGGPYYSDFLLMSIYALAARHANDNDPRFKNVARGEKFLEEAKKLLLVELSASKPKIPTIQGLLILGGRQCAVGKSSEGWLYTGMAIRMMKDIGIHLNAHRLNTLERLQPEDFEARKRLYLSAYVWDKSISLCLGRPPSLTDLPHSVDEILDHCDDLDSWRPVCLGDVEAYYPPCKANVTEALQGFVRLGKLITSILSTIYNRGKTPTALRELQRLENKLHDWYEKLLPDLKIIDATKLEHCPPPHIFSLNILYHTMLIILYRPYLRNQSSTELQTYAHQICVSRSIIINDCFVLYGRSFRHRIMTYLVSYCVYVSSLISVYEIKSPQCQQRQEAAARLSNSLKVLETEANQTPGIRRSIDILKVQLRTLQNVLPPNTMTNSTSPNSASYDNGVKIATTTSPLMTNNMGVTSGPQYPAPLTHVDSLDWDSFDTGAGFMPDAFAWNVDDTWTNNSDFDNMYPASVGSDMALFDPQQQQSQQPPQPPPPQVM